MWSPETSGLLLPWILSASSAFEPYRRSGQPRVFGFHPETTLYSLLSRSNSPNPRGDITLQPLLITQCWTAPRFRSTTPSAPAGS